MKAIVFPAANCAAVYDIPRPATPTDGFLIENRYSLMSSGTELALLNGTHHLTKSSSAETGGYPVYPGYCSLGRVVDVGESANEVAIGDVILHRGAHANYTVCKVGRWRGARLNSDDLKPEMLFAVIGQIAATALYVMGRLPSRGYIYGAGAIGNITAQLLKIQGTPDVFLSTNSALRRAVAEECGIVAALRADKAPCDKTEGCIIETTGREEFLLEALRRLRSRGLLVVLGSPRTPVSVDLYSTVHVKGLHVVGAHEALLPWNASPGQSCGAEKLRESAALIRSSRLVTRPLIWDIVKPSDAPAAYRDLADFKVSKPSCIIDWLADR